MEYRYITPYVVSRTLYIFFLFFFILWSDSGSSDFKDSSTGTPHETVHVVQKSLDWACKGGVKVKKKLPISVMPAPPAVPHETGGNDWRFSGPGWWGGGEVCLSNSIVVRSGVLVDQGFLIINIVIRREGRSGTVGGGWN